MIPAQRGPLSEPVRPAVPVHPAAPTRTSAGGRTTTPQVPAQRLAGRRTGGVPQQHAWSDLPLPHRHAPVPSPRPARVAHPQAATRAGGVLAAPRHRRNATGQPSIGRHALAGPAARHGREGVALSAVLDVVGRIGTAVSLAALLVVAGAVGGLDHVPSATDGTPMTVTAEDGQ